PVDALSPDPIDGLRILGATLGGAAHVPAAALFSQTDLLLAWRGNARRIEVGFGSTHPRGFRRWQFFWRPRSSSAFSSSPGTRSGIISTTNLPLKSPSFFLPPMP